MRSLRTFTSGTTATCNRCYAKSPLPKPCEGHYENARAYRLDTLCALACGHVDAHFVYLSDLPSQQAPAVIALSNDDLARLYLALHARALVFQEQGIPDEAERHELLSLEIARMQKRGATARLVEVEP